jgi:CspA family cold shock protein
MPSGIVKWFNSAKGYGFICPEDGGQDVFAHFSAIVMDGYKCLKAGQPVLYEVNEGPKGLHASNIRADINQPAENEASKPRTKETATAEA